MFCDFIISEKRRGVVKKARNNVQALSGEISRNELQQIMFQAALWGAAHTVRGRWLVNKVLSAYEKIALFS